MWQGMYFHSEVAQSLVANHSPHRIDRSLFLSPHHLVKHSLIKYQIDLWQFITANPPSSDSKPVDVNLASE
jgi:hypothetical protein